MAVTTIKPSTRWVINQFSPFADFQYKQGNKPAKELGARLDKFEDYTSMSDVPIIDPNSGRLLWSHVADGDNAKVRRDAGDLSITDINPIEGSRSIAFTAATDPNDNIGDNAPVDYTPIPSAPYLQFYTHSDQRWQYIHEVIQNNYGDEWKFNFYNRLVFYVKTPEETVVDGNMNLSVGTYYASIINGPPTSGDAEVGGGNHGYHRYKISNGVTTKVIVDFNPTHIRGAGGGQEQPYMEYPILSDAGKYNYWDMLTRLYFAGARGSEFGLEYQFDNFYFYRENRKEENHEVYSLAASYKPSLGETYLSFNVNKERVEEDAFYEVRYAFTDIHELGFDNAPLWMVTGDQGYQGENIVGISTTDIDVGSNSILYLAVKKVGDTLFRQIDLEL